jgi:hypothetical protein
MGLGQDYPHRYGAIVGVQRLGGALLYVGADGVGSFEVAKGDLEVHGRPVCERRAIYFEELWRRKAGKASG